MEEDEIKYPIDSILEDRFDPWDEERPERNEDDEEPDLGEDMD